MVSHGNQHALVLRQYLGALLSRCGVHAGAVHQTQEGHVLQPDAAKDVREAAGPGGGGQRRVEREVDVEPLVVRTEDPPTMAS